MAAHQDEVEWGADLAGVVDGADVDVNRRQGHRLATDGLALPRDVVAAGCREQSLSPRMEAHALYLHRPQFTDAPPWRRSRVRLTQIYTPPHCNTHNQLQQTCAERLPFFQVSEVIFRIHSCLKKTEVEKRKHYNGKTFDSNQINAKKPPCITLRNHRTRS